MEVSLKIKQHSVKKIELLESLRCTKSCIFLGEDMEESGEHVITR